MISDKTTDMAAAAMDVRVGHFSDPDDTPGLAHFLEHMLFLGTKHYPDENQYSQFLSAHGGSSNAYTACQHTNYHFDVMPEHLESALDMFAWFFIHPLFNEGATRRELQAVDSEHGKNLQNDAWRIFQTTKHLSRPQHPFHRFGTGNAKTLDKAWVRQRLLEFHERHYGAPRMCLAVLGRESLDSLETMVQRFSAVRSSAADALTVQPDPFGPGLVRRNLLLEPVQDRRMLRLTFLLDGQARHHETKPAEYLARFIGDEGPGSILACLKRRGLAMELSAGIGMDEDAFATFDVTIELTIAGTRDPEHVKALVFRYLDLLRRHYNESWRYEEAARINQQMIATLPTAEPIDHVTTLATDMHRYPLKAVLLAGVSFRRYDEQLIEWTLERLNPKNMYCLHVWPGVLDSVKPSVEPWYGTKYRAVPTPDIGTTDASFVLPGRNRYIASDVSFRPIGSGGESESPRLVSSADDSPQWYWRDTRKLTPKVHVMLRITTTERGVQSLVLRHLFCRALQSRLDEQLYQARVAGLAFGVEATCFGLELNFRGFNDNMPGLVTDVLKTMLGFEPDEQRFRTHAEQFRTDLQNHATDQPYRHAAYHASLMLTRPQYPWTEQLKALDGLESKDLHRHMGRSWRRTNREWFVAGNVTADEVPRYTMWPGSHASFPSVPMQRRMRLGPRHYRYDSVESNEEQTCSAVSIQCCLGAATQRTRAMARIIAHMMSEPFYHDLRTTQQLGYLVFSGQYSVLGVTGLRWIVQSEKATVRYLEQQIMRFIDGFQGSLDRMSAETFEENRRAVVKERRERPVTLRAAVRRFKQEIRRRAYRWDRREKEARELERLDLASVRSFYRRLVGSDAERAILCSRARGNERKRTLDAEESTARVAVVKDLNQLKLTLKAFPAEAPAVGNKINADVYA